MIGGYSLVRRRRHLIFKSYTEFVLETRL
ncbi:hypothetical protein AHF37_12778 [Paragonimus kellicotti]|nr:hypothetical protein AHF37_12778 [Paragonimus kellicotti]